MIEVTLTKPTDLYEFDVRVTEGGTETRHRVTMADATYQCLAGEQASPERVIEAAVRGMLPKNRLGRKMFKKLKVYAGPDHPHQAQQPKALDM